MIHFRFLLSKRCPDIFLFQRVIRLITNARQNFETFEVKQNQKENKIVLANIVCVINAIWELDYVCFRSSLCLRMFTNRCIILYLAQKKKDLEMRAINARQNLELVWSPGEKNNIAFSRSFSTSIIEN